MNTRIHNSLNGLLVAALFALSVVGCDDDESNDECGGHGHLHDGHCDCDEGYVQDPDDEENCIEDTGESWCMEGRENWEQCEDGVILWCHVMDGMQPHPHAGQDCAADGLECVQVSDSDAACVDMSTSCTQGEHECSAENEALNCVDGHWAVEPCGSLRCHDEDDGAVCEEGDVECGGHGHLEGDECHCDEGYIQDPDDPTTCIDEVSFPQRACNTFADGDPEEKSVTTTFEDVFDHATHADLDMLVHVTLPGTSEPSYIHFPIIEDGDYVIFLDTDDVFVTAWHRDHSTEFTTTGGVANGMCETDLVDHWHISATYDGDGSGPVPGVLEFEPVDTETEVQFIVSLLEEDHDH